MRYPAGQRIGFVRITLIAFGCGLIGVGAAMLLTSCATTQSYLDAHPEVAARIVQAVQAVQCLEPIVSEPTARPLDPNPYVPAPEPADAGVPTWFTDGGHNG